MKRRKFIGKAALGTAAMVGFHSIVPANVLGKNAPSNKINIGQFTQPIKVANGFLILLINNKQIITSKINEEDLLNSMIEYEENQQFEKFSQIYYNKIKLNTLIDEE